MIDVRIVNADGVAAEVTPSHELVTSQLVPSNPVTITMGAIDTAFNFNTPVPSQELLITDIIISTNKDVGVSGATVVIYEASTATTTTVDKEIISMNVLKNSNVPMTSLRWKVTEGKFLNAKTDDDVVTITIASHVLNAHVVNPAQLGVGEDV